MIFLKTEDEIELMRAANLLVAATLAEVGKHIQPGVTTKQLDRIADAVSEIFDKRAEFHDRIQQVRSETVFNIGRSGEAGGKYIIQRIIEKDRRRKEEE